MLLLYEITQKVLRMAELITKSRFHRTLDGIELVKNRQKAGLTQAEFAQKAGWSQQYQCQLEAPGEHEVPISVANKILEVLNER